MTDDDPTRAFLDNTVPRDDAWEGVEPPEGPARPRHLTYSTEPDSLRTAQQRRRDTIRNAAWTFGPSVAYLAGSAAFAGQASADPDPDDSDDLDYGDVGDIGSGL